MLFSCHFLEKSMDKQAIKKVLHRLYPDKNNKKVFVVSGAPGSGKSTYVQKTRNADDLVVDMDLIAAALKGTPEWHPQYRPVMDAALSAREAIYSTIERRKGEWKTAFVITSSPDASRVAALAKRLNAEIVEMDTQKDECVKRILEDDSRNDAKKDVALVEAWFSRK